MPSYEKNPSHFVFPNPHNGWFTMHFFIWNLSGKGRFLSHSPTSYTNAIILLSHRKRDRKKKRRQSY